MPTHMCRAIALPSNSARSVAMIAASAMMYRNHKRQWSATLYFGYFSLSRRINCRV